MAASSRKSTRCTVAISLSRSASAAASCSPSGRAAAPAAERVKASVCTTQAFTGRPSDTVPAVAPEAASIIVTAPVASQSAAPPA